VAGLWAAFDFSKTFRRGFARINADTSAGISLFVRLPWGLIFQTEKIF
jgi:hypothetical protein